MEAETDSEIESHLYLNDCGHKEAVNPKTWLKEENVSFLFQQLWGSHILNQWHLTRCLLNNAGSLRAAWKENPQMPDLTGKTHGRTWRAIFERSALWNRYSWALHKEATRLGNELMLHKKITPIKLSGSQKTFNMKLQLLPQTRFSVPSLLEVVPCHHSWSDLALTPQRVHQTTPNEFCGRPGFEGPGNSPWPLSRNSVMMAALQGDQGLVRLIWMRVGDIMWLSCSFPNTSAHALTLSCGMLNTCPVEQEQQHVKCLTQMDKYHSWGSQHHTGWRGGMLHWLRSV